MIKSYTTILPIMGDEVKKLQGDIIQNDTNEINVQLVDGANKPFSIANATRIAATIIKPNGNVVILEDDVILTDAAKGAIKVKIRNQVTNIAGACYLTFSFHEGEEKRITSSTLSFQVIADPMTLNIDTSEGINTTTILSSFEGLSEEEKATLKGEPGAQGIPGPQGIPGEPGLKGEPGDLSISTEYEQLPTTDKTVLGAIAEVFTKSNDMSLSVETAIIGKEGTVSKAGEIATTEELVAGIATISGISGIDENMVLFHVKVKTADNQQVDFTASFDATAQQATITGKEKVDIALPLQPAYTVTLEHKAQYSLPDKQVIECIGGSAQEVIFNLTLGNVYLYKEGDEYAALTGGWKQGAKAGTAEIVKGADNIQLSASAANSYIILVTTNKINTVGFSKLIMLCDTVVGSRDITLCITDLSTGDFNNGAKTVISQSITDTTISVDLANYQGEYYVSVFPNTSTAATNIVTVKKIWLEPMEEATYLYKEGDEYAALTGGWNGVVVTSAKNGAATKNEKSLTVNTGTSGSYEPREKSVFIQTVNKIDLTDYAYIHVHVVNSQISTASKAGLCTSTEKVTTATKFDYPVIDDINVVNAANDTIMTLDISEATGEAYITLHAYASYSSSSYKAILEVDKIWLEPKTFLYKLGDEYAALTGGWSSYGVYGSVNCVKSSDCLSLIFGSGWRTGAFGMGNKLDLTNFSKIIVDFEFTISGLTNDATSGYERPIILIQTEKSVNSTYGSLDTTAVKSLMSGNTARVTKTIDISDIEGEYFINFGANVNSSGGTLKLYALSLV